MNETNTMSARKTKAVLKIRKLNSYVGWFLLNEAGGGSGSNERLSKKATISKVLSSTIYDVVGVFDEDKRAWIQGGAF